MVQIVGLILVSLGIFTLFSLDLDKTRMSKAVWVPFIWLLIASSRPITSWATFSVPDGTDQYIDGSPIDRNALTVLFVLSLIILAKRGRQVVSIIKANPAIVLYFLYCLVTLLWADYPFVVFKRWVRSVADVTMIVVIVTEADWPAVLNRVLTRIGYLLLPLSILFIRFFPSLGRSYSVGGAPMWTGVATDKNALGATCMLVGVTLFWRWLAIYKGPRDKYRRRQLLTVGALFLVAVYLLLVANSQTALSCFTIGLTLVLLTNLGPVFRKPAVVGIVAATMVGVAFCVLFLGIGGGALSLIGRNSTLTGRTEVWQGVLPFATNAWLGAGYENFWIGDRLLAVERAVGTGLNQAHNGYIELYLNIGWIGLILLGGIIVTGYRNIMHGFRTEPAISALRLAFFCICLVYNFTEAAFKMMSPVWMLFLWGAMALPALSPAKAAPMEPVKAGEYWGGVEPEYSLVSKRIAN